MDIAVHQDALPCRAELRGELDIYCAGELRERLLELLNLHPALELDLSGVDGVDGAGLQVLIAAKSLANRLGHGLALRGHSPAVLEALELCRLQSYFGDPVVESPIRREDKR